MIREAALLFARLARRVLPPGREAWGAAMEAEVAHIGGQLAPLTFSLGCFGGALRDRARHVPSLALAGIWVVALATGALALFQIGCAAGGVAIALGAPDPYLEALLRGTAEQKSIGAAYSRATPAIVVCLIGLGAAQMLAAFFLFGRKRRPFVISSLAALAFCAVLAGLITWIGVGSAGLPLQWSALILQAIAVPLLWPRLPTHPKPWRQRTC